MKLTDQVILSCFFFPSYSTRQWEQKPPWTSCGSNLWYIECVSHRQKCELFVLLLLESLCLSEQQLLTFLHFLGLLCFRWGVNGHSECFLLNPGNAKSAILACMLQHSYILWLNCGASIHSLPIPLLCRLTLSTCPLKKASQVPNALCLACIITLYLGHTALFSRTLFYIQSGPNQATVGECIVMNAKAEH